MSVGRAMERERDRKARRAEERKLAKRNQREERERRAQIEAERQRRAEIQAAFDEEAKAIWHGWTGSAIGVGATPLQLHEFVVCWGAARQWTPAKIQATINKMADLVTLYTRSAESQSSEPPILSDLFSPEQRRMASLMADLHGNGNGIRGLHDRLKRAAKEVTEEPPESIVGDLPPEVLEF